ncbi:cobalamin-dependent protein [Candidatus Nitrosopelagicus sp.]|nr:cobalamin-dependent protein [Candidatus Nitrosopelagicus sp.]
MVYIRKKNVKNVDYLYLVKSTWDKIHKTSRQETIKYLGAINNVTQEDIPEEYRNDPKIQAFLLENTPKDREKREKIIEKLQLQIFSCLTEGDLDGAKKTYRAFLNDNSLDQFYEKILNPVMEKIGTMWSNGILSVATEHVSSNIAHSLVKIISEEKKGRSLHGKIILTTPVGEEHNLGCSVMESFLLNKGFTTFNLSPSTPAESVLNFMRSITPDAIIISITLPDSIPSGQRLTKKIREFSKKIPIYVGGQAFKDGSKAKFDANVIDDINSLTHLPRIMKTRKKK